ncbi:NnrS family protein [Pseudocolwellia agarivorans]|uniref:NnrS family protein n=1 Tax=Pseudocolwellia agarivorans TaxID=1911682 RepID=UPI0009866460|nr:NnrS family protein [Pseudocolwellia agarivorans]
MLQITDPEKEQKTPPLLRLGFRPFFLFGSVFSVVSMILWLFMLKGNITLSPLGGMHWWHIHEMTFGFGCAITVGFLLTAVQTWTGIKGVQGTPLLLLFILWMLGRVFVLFPHILGGSLSSIIDISFLPISAYMLGKPIIAIKQYRNLFFVPLLLLFTLANIAMHLSLSYPEIFSYQLSSYTGIMLIVLLMSVISGRVVPMFTANGTKTSKASPSPTLDKLTNIPLALAMLMLLLHPLITFNALVFGSLLIFSGVFQTIRWFKWKPYRTLNVPLVWALHSGLMFISFGLVLLGLSYIHVELPSHHIWHLITIGGIGGLIIAMITRVSLGHTGRPLIAPKAIPLAYFLIIVATIIRVFSPWIWPARTAVFIDISGFLWILSFTLFIYHYMPMLLSPRADNKSG